MKIAAILAPLLLLPSIAQADCLPLAGKWTLNGTCQITIRANGATYLDGNGRCPKRGGFNDDVWTILKQDKSCRITGTISPDGKITGRQSDGIIIGSISNFGVKTELFTAFKD